MNRRRLLQFLGLGGLVGIPSTAAAVQPAEKTVGVIVFYIYIGMMQKEDIQAYLKKTSEQLGPAKDGWDRYLWPVRQIESSRVEVFFNGHDKGGAEKMMMSMRDSMTK